MKEKELDTIYDALDECSRVIFCNRNRQCMFIVDYDRYEFINGPWFSKIFLYKDNIKCGEIISENYEEWFIDDNHQICIIP